MPALSATTGWRIRVFVAVSAVSAVFGALFTLTGAVGAATPSSGLLVGAAIGGAITALEMLLQGPWAHTIRRLPVAAVLAGRTALYGVVFWVVNAGTNWIFDGSGSDPVGFTPVNLAFSFAVALAMNLFLFCGC